MVDNAIRQVLSAISEGNLNKVKLLLSDGLDVNVPFGRDSDTFLHLATHVEIINELLSRGADVNATDSSGETPLFRAIVDGKGLLVVKALLSAKADVNGKYYGHPLLHFSLADADVTRELILHGSEVNSRDQEGRTLLHDAVSKPGALETVKVLLKHGAEVDALNNYGKTPLYGITGAIGGRLWGNPAYNHLKDDLEVVKELLEYGADINPGESISSPLVIGLCCEQSLLTELLIRIWVFIHFDEDYLNKLKCSININNFLEVKGFIEKCVSEINKLKCDFIYNNQSIYDFISFKKNLIIRPLYCADEIVERSKYYPIYNDIVFSRLKLCLEKAKLLLKLRGFQIYSVKEGFGEVILNPDCISRIGEYLSNDDLKNFMMAFS